VLGLDLVGRGHLDPDHLGYAATILVVWKLGISYRLHLWQARSFELYRYFGGETRNGMLVMFVGMFLRSRVLSFFGGGMATYILG
jgi:hypothetical protein